MQYETVRFFNDDLIGYIGICSYCGRDISECCKHEKVAFGLVCSGCFVWYCYDRGIKSDKTRNVVEF
jgi:hypothetical protein